jgi:hypothetical protein
MQQSDAMGRVDTNVLDQVGGCESYSVIGPLVFNFRWVVLFARFPDILELYFCNLR